MQFYEEFESLLAKKEKLQLLQGEIFTAKDRGIPEDLIWRKHWSPSAYTLPLDCMKIPHSPEDGSLSQALCQFNSGRKNRRKIFDWSLNTVFSALQCSSLSDSVDLKYVLQGWGLTEIFKKTEKQIEAGQRNLAQTHPSIKEVRNIRAQEAR